MPPQAIWESFFDPGGVLEALDCRDVRGDLIEFGCGYGSFAVAAAPRVSGTVYAIDIDPTMVEATARRAELEGCANVTAELRDFVAGGCGRGDATAAFAMLFNILHIENPVSLLREAYRAIRSGGTLGVIHWKCDSATPRGPPLDIRPTPADCRGWAEQAGFRWVRYQDFASSPWHWGMVMTRP